MVLEPPVISVFMHLKFSILKRKDTGLALPSSLSFPNYIQACPQMHPTVFLTASAEPTSTSNSDPLLRDFSKTELALSTTLDPLFVNFDSEPLLAFQRTSVLAGCSLSEIAV